MQNREKNIYKVTLIGSVVNALLVIIKFAAGILGKSSALIADSVHSLTDFVSDFVVLIFVRISSKPRDDDHRYGHGKFETLATLIIGVLLAGAGIGLLIDGAEHVIRSLKGEILPQPTWVALSIAIVSILSKEILYRYTIKEGKRFKSDAVIANAWHHRSDAISSLGTTAGIAGAMFFGAKWRILDPIAAILVSLLIIKSGYDIIRPALSELLESSLSKDKTDEIEHIISGVPGVKDFHNLRTRKIGSSIAVDVHVKMDGNLSLSEAHDIASEIEKGIRAKFGKDSLISIHMEPFRNSLQ